MREQTADGRLHLTSAPRASSSLVPCSLFPVPSSLFPVPSSQLRPAPPRRSRTHSREDRMEGETLMFAQVMTVIVLSLASFVAIGLGARVLWRMGSSKPARPALPADDDRLQRLEQGMETMAVELERVSEAQRFMVTLL